MPRLRSLSVALIILLLVALAAAALLWPKDRPAPPEQRRALGLFTSLPIYWGEAEDLSSLLDDAGEPHWVRAELEASYDLQPLDVLTADHLASLTNLLIAQPRALAAAENVALDDWLRGGGHALLFADPVLTQHSRFALGDARRPMDTVLLSPILAHWGLELRFDDNQPSGLHLAKVLGASVPVEEAGTLIALSGADESECELLTDGLAAQCELGKGTILILADAAVLDGEGDTSLHRDALSLLLDVAFPRP